MSETTIKSNDFTSSVMVIPTIRLTSGSKKMAREDFGDADKLPDEKFFSTGIKRFINPLTLAPFNAMRTEACAVIMRHGALNIRGVYFVDGKELDSLDEDLIELRKKWDAKLTEFLGNYTHDTDEWIRSSGEFEQALRAVVPSGQEIARSFEFSWLFSAIAPIEMPGTVQTIAQMAEAGLQSVINEAQRIWSGGAIVTRHTAVDLLAGQHKTTGLPKNSRIKDMAMSFWTRHTMSETCARAAHYISAKWHDFGLAVMAQPDRAENMKNIFAGDIDRLFNNDSSSMAQFLTGYSPATCEAQVTFPLFPQSVVVDVVEEMRQAKPDPLEAAMEQESKPEPKVYRGSDLPPVADDDEPVDDDCFVTTVSGEPLEPTPEMEEAAKAATLEGDRTVLDELVGSVDVDAVAPAQPAPAPKQEMSDEDFLAAVFGEDKSEAQPAQPAQNDDADEFDALFD